jgi:hypothetical protein
VETLNALAEALESTLEELLVPVRPLTKVRFRAQKKLHSREEVLANVARQLDHYAQLEEILGLPRMRDLEKARRKAAGLRGSHRPIHAARETLGKAAEILELDLEDMRELSNSWAV